MYHMASESYIDSVVSLKNLNTMLWSNMDSNVRQFICVLKWRYITEASQPNFNADDPTVSSNYCHIYPYDALQISV